MPTAPFDPSNARTEDGKLIPVEHFFPASRCLSCHQDTHTAWSESLHRNAAREPFYRESADILLRTRGIEFTRHCESCHTPVALFAGALSKSSPRQQVPFTPLDDEGVTCSVCHSITEATVNGTGSFTIRRPALLAREDGTPVYSVSGGDITNDQILADVPAHKRAVMRPLLKSPEFCATCHKVDAPPSLNGYKHIRGFSAYDEWQQSGASHESILPFYCREQRVDCRSCHMPKVESHNDRAAKEGKIASHRWLGANTAAPLFYGQIAQAQATEDFLKTDVLDVDIFALKRDSAGGVIAPLKRNGANQISLAPGDEVTVEVVVANRNAAHSFPPEVRDLYEAWVEFQVLDASGKTVFHSGFVKADGMLDESAHVYKQIILDEQGRQITRHQIWTTNIKAYDNTINAGRSDVVRFRFRLPGGDTARGRGGEGETRRQGDRGKFSRSFVNSAIRNPQSAITLRAHVNYRRLNQEYINYVLNRQKRSMKIPIVQMAEAETKLAVGGLVVINRSGSGSETPEWKRWNDYGIGLLEQAQYGAAAEAFQRASGFNPTDPNLLVNAAIAEMQTERFAPEREQFRKAALLLDAALQLAPQHARTRYYRALVWRADGRFREAAEELKQIAGDYPRDREVQRQLAHTLWSLGRLAEARGALETVLRIDPTDFLAYQFLSPLYLSEGRKAEAARANALYLLWRDDPRADAIAARFYAAHPEWADERIGSHTHDQHSSRRPVLIGQHASPDK
ncbi:MAG: tetratricopeptide repeat protein [Blastocatellia bacterium]